MRFSTTLIFSLLFAMVVAAYLYLVPAKEPAKPSPQEEALAKLLPLAEDDEIVRIDIDDDENRESIVLQKEQDLWMITRPVHYPAETVIVEGLVSALKLSFKARRLVPEKDWAEYGLETPRVRVGIETRRSERKRVLVFGDPSPVGRFIYARWIGETEYFLLDENLKRAFERTLYSLREKRIFRTPLKEIRKIRIKSGTREYEMLKQAAGWVWTEPIPVLGAEVSPKYGDEFLSEIRDLSSKEFLDAESRPDRELGLTLGANFIAVWGEDERNPETLLLGNEEELRDAYYAKRKDERVCFLLSRGNIRRLLQTVETMVREAGSKTT